MAPKKKVEEAPPPVEEKEPEEPEEPEVFKKCFRIGGQLYYGDSKAGGKARPGTFIRHGFGRQVDLAATPAGSRFSDETAYETVVTGIYEGSWDEDAISGQGTYKWSDGSSYEGHFENGQLSGHGRFVWPDGSAYEGAFVGGTMNGQGRLDSRFDGKFHQGKFHRNCFQQASGRWLDILEKARREDSARIATGDVDKIQVLRCAFGECWRPDARQAKMDVEKEALVRMLEQIQSDGLIPLVAAEACLGGSALDCLTAASLVDAETQGVSVRLAAIAQRRRRDCHSMFHDAIQQSLRTGSLFVVTFEDDDVGCSMQQEEQEDWTKRAPDTNVPETPMPEEWALENFFLPTAFPVEVFQPELFNGRNLARCFLPEAAQQLRPYGPPQPGSLADASVGSGGHEAAVAEEAAGEEDPEAHAAALTEKQAAAAEARKLVEKAAAGVTVGMVGSTGHFFEVGDASLEAAGLPLAYCLRPALCVLGRLPEGLGDEEVKELIIKRFGNHVPLHRTVLLLLGDREEVPETLQ